MLAWVDITGGDSSELECLSGTPGFAIEWERRAVSLGRVLLSLRVRRTAPTPRTLCLVRFRLGRSSAAASITVLDA